MYNHAKRICRALSTATVAVMVLTAFSTATAQELLIDDFNSGPIADLAHYDLRGSGNEVTQTQSGASIVGGIRRIQYQIGLKDEELPGAVTPAGRLSVHTGSGLLIASGDYRTSQFVRIRYPIPNSSRDFSAYERLQLEFEGMNRALNIVATMCESSCANRISHSITHSDFDSENREIATLYLRDFTSPRAVTFNPANVRWLFVVVNTQHPTHAEDFGLSSISLR